MLRFLEVESPDTGLSERFLDGYMVSYVRELPKT